MIITGKNLLGLIRQYEMCPERLFDQFSISLELDSCILVPQPQSEPIRYDMEETQDLFREEPLANGELVLHSKQAVLACSADVVCMPPGYMGLLQSKGSLARLFVSVHCADSQIEPGFSGKVTFEIVNHAPFPISLAFRAKVAQVYVLKCADDSTSDVYRGRYQHATRPTAPRLAR